MTSDFPSPGAPPGPRPPAPPPPEPFLAAIVNSSDDAIISKDLLGIITTWNKSAERIFGYAAREAVGTPISRLIPPDRFSEAIRLFERVCQGERIDRFETVRLRKDGTTVEVAITFSPIRDVDGKVVGASKIARDVGEIGRQGRQSRLLAAIVDSSDDAIISKNLDGIITSWNAGAQRIFGYTAVETVGRSVLILVPDDRKEEEPGILQRLRRGERVEHFETVRVHKNGQQFSVSLTISPVKNREGTIVGASKIARDISDLKRISAEREQLLESERAARSHAERASRMKDDFLATVSHELRTPLNAIVGWTEVLKTVQDQPGEVANCAEVIERNAFMQAQLIEDLLDLGRISSGKMALAVEEVDVGAIVREAMAAVQHAADLKRIAIKTVIDNRCCTMLGDVKRLQQVIWNLLSNAIKFTPNDGRVLLTVARTKSHLKIAVADSGRGIDAAFLPHLFERFSQADSSTTRREGGLGIGLALVKQLVEMHAGTVRAESPGLGHGSTFTVTLPVAVALADRPRPAQPVDLPSAADLADLNGIQVLAVDDDRDSLEILKRILTNRGADVRTASSVMEALTVLKTFSPNVILSDIGMPVQDGYELIRRVRQLPGVSSVPAVALTALSRADDRMRALKAGFQTHVAKPVAAAEIIAVVRSMASLREERRGPEN